MAKRYNLTSEITRVKNQHPNFELLLPRVEMNYVDTPAPENPSPMFEEDVVMVAPAQMFPDEVVVLASTDPVRAAQILLGTKYAHFAAAGGTATVLFQIIQENAKADLGE